MPRARTDAPERARQRKATQAQVSAEVGKKVGVREAARQRQARKASPLGEDVPYRVVDRVVEYEAQECKPLGEVLARVVDFKILSPGFAQLSLQTTGSEFGHTLTDASLISRGHLLLVKLFELVPDPTAGSPADATG